MMQLWVLSAAAIAWFPYLVHGVRRVPNDILLTSTTSEGNVRHLSQDLEDDKRRKEELQRWSELLQERSLGNDQNTGPSSPDEHLITSIPLLPDGKFPTKQWSGHIPASHDDDKKLFYWLFEPDFSLSNGGDQNVPLLIWLNGGPGCSSMDGLFIENGPFRLVQDLKSHEWELGLNDASWHKAPAYTLYIDQPVGTGLSFTKKKKYCKNDLEINVDFHYFLTEFLLLHKDKFLKPLDERQATKNPDENDLRYIMKVPFYFSGESHAGHYIPSMMDYILQRNDDTEEDPPRIIMPLAGAAIGNGWVDPFHQYAGASAAYGVGLIDFAQKSRLDEMEIECQNNMNNGNLHSGVCFDIIDNIVDQSVGKSSKYKVSQYDNRRYEEKNAARTFPPGHREIEHYLGGSLVQGLKYETVLEALHASESVKAGQHYLECTNPPFNALSHQDGLGVVSEVVRILNHPTKPRLLFFNGMNDIICNHAGNEKLLDKLPWRYADEWTMTPRYAWRARSSEMFNGPPVNGYMKQFENLLFLKVLESGHMVPMDQPDVSLDMMITFMHNGHFEQSQQDLKRRKPEDDSMLGVTECLPCPNCELEGTSAAPASGSSLQAKNDVEGTETVEAQKESSQQQQQIQEGGLSKNTGEMEEEAEASSSLNYYNDADTEGEVSAPVRRSLIAGGWMGATLGVIALLYMTFMKQRVRRGIVVVRGGDYDDFGMEMTEDTSAASTEDGSGVSVEYHDDPSISSSSDIGGRAII